MAYDEYSLDAKTARDRHFDPRGSRTPSRIPRESETAIALGSPILEADSPAPWRPIYTPSPPPDKKQTNKKNRTGTPSSALGTIDHGLHPTNVRATRCLSIPRSRESSRHGLETDTPSLPFPSSPLPPYPRQERRRSSLEHRRPAGDQHVSIVLSQPGRQARLGDPAHGATAPPLSAKEVLPPDTDRSGRGAVQSTGASRGREASAGSSDHDALDRGSDRITC